MITFPDEARQRGFAIVSALFIIVALAVLAGFIATVSSSQHIGSALDVLGARAYQAARAGTEWGMANAHNAGICSASSSIAPINGMAITVQCATVASGASGVEAGLSNIFLVTAIACNQPDATGACPGNAAAANYVERRLSALVE